MSRTSFTRDSCTSRGWERRRLTSCPIFLCHRLTFQNPHEPPVHYMRSASLRDALALPAWRSLLPIAFVISMVVAIGVIWIASETALPVADNTFASTTLPTSLPSLPTLLPSAEPLTWSLDLVSRSLFGGQTPSQAKGPPLPYPTDVSRPDRSSRAPEPNEPGPANKQYCSSERLTAGRYVRCTRRITLTAHPREPNLTLSYQASS